MTSTTTGTGSGTGATASWATTAFTCLDVARWGLGVGYPIRVTSGGGRYHFPDDDQETPDTHRSSPTTMTATSRSPGTTRAATPSSPAAGAPRSSSTAPTARWRSPAAATRSTTSRARRLKARRVLPGDPEHLANFLAAIRGEAELNSEIGEGHDSTLLCHLGNIAHRTGRALKLRPQERPHPRRPGRHEATGPASTPRAGSRRYESNPHRGTGRVRAGPGSCPEPGSIARRPARASRAGDSVAGRPGDVPAQRRGADPLPLRPHPAAAVSFPGNRGLGAVADPHGPPARPSRAQPSQLDLDLAQRRGRPVILGR